MGMNWECLFCGLKVEDWYGPTPCRYSRGGHKWWSLNPPPLQVEYDERAVGLHCPRCLEPAGQSCKARSGRRLVRTHIERRLATLSAAT